MSRIGSGQYVDRDQNGFVEGAEFWIAFSKVGDRYREKIRLQENEQNEKRRAAINNFAQKLADEKAERRRLAKLAKKKVRERERETKCSYGFEVHDCYPISYF